MSEPQADPAPDETVDPDQTADETADPTAEESPEFTNRAARRAKGKTAKPAVFAKGKQPVGRGAVQSPRQYGNRRSG